MKHIKTLIKRIPLKPFWRFVCVFCLIVLTALALVQPIKNRAWRLIKQQGDTALLNQNFEQAKIEYLKLKLIFPKNPEPDELIALAEKGQADLLTLRKFYSDHNRLDIVALFDKATKEYETEQEATNACQELLKDNQPALALRCITTTTTKWPLYRDAWLTQGFIAESLGNQALAEESRAKALEIDPATVFP